MPGIQNKKSTLDFLGTLGISGGDDVKLGHTAQALVKLAEILIGAAEDNLDKNGNRATGKTASSMKIENLQTQTTKMSLDVVIDKNYKFLDMGVQGTEGGKGKFKFKTKYPNKKMALAILKWLKVRRIVSKYKPISKTESKNKRLKKLSGSSNSQKSLAYAIATNIKKKGIKPTHFFSDAIKTAKEQQKKVIGDAFRLDIIESLS